MRFSLSQIHDFAIEEIAVRAEKWCFQSNASVLGTICAEVGYGLPVITVCERTA
jgi:hypothetical protein